VVAEDEPGPIAAADVGPSLWWLFLIFGACWLIFALIVFRFDYTTVNSISILFGAVCISAAVVEFFSVAAVAGWWRLLHVLLGLAFLVVGIVAFIHPGNTFEALAAVFAFFLLLHGVYDIGVAIVARELELWWVGLVTGVIQILLAFWATGDFGHKAILLVIWVGASALLAGIRQIVFAFQLRGMSKHGPPQFA